MNFPNWIIDAMIARPVVFETGNPIRITQVRAMFSCRLIGGAA